MNPAPAGLCCIVLAAGSSRRFGADKRQARLADGRTLLDATLDGIPPLFAQRLLILQPGDDAVTLTRHSTAWQVITATEAGFGMGHSLAAGLAACQPCTAALVVLADMPAVSQSTYQALAAQLGRNRIVVPRHHGKRGNPVGIGADFFAELLQPAGDSGARRLLQQHPEAVVWVDCDEDAGILLDIDTQQDLAQ